MAGDTLSRYGGGAVYLDGLGNFLNIFERGIIMDDWTKKSREELIIECAAVARDYLMHVGGGLGMDLYRTGETAILAHYGLIEDDDDLIIERGDK